MKLRTTLIALLVLSLSSTLLAQDSKTAELRKRFEQRFPRLQQLKQAGTIGETSDGLVDFVDKPDPAAADVVNQENTDRKELYDLLAAKENITPAAVAQRAAKRNFERAKPGEYLKQDGKWSKKS